MHPNAFFYYSGMSKTSSSVSHVTSDDLRTVATLVRNTLRTLIDRDWNIQAAGTDFTVRETVDHMTDSMFAYAAQNSAVLVGGDELRETWAPLGYVVPREGGPFLTVWADPERGNNGSVQVYATTAGILVAVTDSSLPTTRGHHPYGLSDAEGFVAMAIVESLIHLADVTNAFDTTFTPPIGVCERVLSRLFPDVVEQTSSTSSHAWNTLRYATGRTPLDEWPQRIEWSWNANVQQQ